MHRLDAAKVSIDSSVALDFHLTNSVEILEELFADRMLVSDFVTNELPKSMRFGRMKTVPLVDAPQWDLFEKLKKDKPALGAGEIGAIVVAKTHDAVLLTNDKPARHASRRLGIEVSGSIGILEYAVESGRMRGEDAIDLLKQMIEQGARIANELVFEFENGIRNKKKTEVIERLCDATSPEKLKAADTSRGF